MFVKILTAKTIECSLDIESGRRYQRFVQEKIKRWILP